MLKVLLPENQKYKNIYSSLSDFFNSLDQKNWLINYLFWEINLITNLGFGFQSDIKSVSGSNVNNIYNFIESFKGLTFNYLLYMDYLWV